MAFGQMAEITGTAEWKLNDVNDISSLRKMVETTYPASKNINYLIAIDKKIVNGDAPIPANATVALLPPFSGG